MPDLTPVQAGNRLDAHHDAVGSPVLAICMTCGISTHEVFDRPLRHLPLHDELDRAQAWLDEHDTPPGPAA
jgi:hypothetical protein